MKAGSIWHLALEKGASDIHAVTGRPPMLRIDGVLGPVSHEELTEAQVRQLILEVLSEEQLAGLEGRGTVECAHETESGERFRISTHLVGGMPALSARLVPSVIPRPEDIGMPDVILDLCRNRCGLVVFTGPSGSGKSTSMASIVAALADQQPLHIVTLEDPIEFRFSSDRSLLSQRELGRDFHSFSQELARLLRQDADIILVGEMRDLDTMRQAITLAETGHLVLTTLHTSDAVQTVDRIVAGFPPDEQTLVRSRLATTLTAVVAQRLYRRIGGGRIANREVLIGTSAVATLIRESRVREIPNVMETSGGIGMVTFNRDRQRLVAAGLLPSPNGG